MARRRALAPLRRAVAALAVRAAAGWGRVSARDAAVGGAAGCVARLRWGLVGGGGGGGGARAFASAAAASDSRRGARRWAVCFAAEGGGMCSGAVEGVLRDGLRAGVRRGRLLHWSASRAGERDNARGAAGATEAEEGDGAPGGGRRTRESREYRFEQLRALGIADAAIEAWPPLLRCSFDDNIKPTFEKLRGLGMSAKAICSHPQLLGLSFEDNIKPTFDFLRDELGFSEKAIHPQLLVLRKQTLQSKFEQLRDELRIPEDKISANLLHKSIEDNLKPSFNTLVDELNFPADYVRDNPTLLALSIATIREKVLLMREHGLPEDMVINLRVLNRLLADLRANLGFLFGDEVRLPPEHVKKVMLLCKSWQLPEQWARRTAGRDVSAMSDAERAEALRGAVRCHAPQDRLR